MTPLPPAPEFPQFKPLELEDRTFISPLLWAYQPETSELTFTNLFIWRSFYQTRWCRLGDWLLFACRDAGGNAFALPPVGPAPRLEVSRRLLEWLRAEQGAPRPHIDRADRRLAAETAASAELRCEAVRDHFDYVYRTSDLIGLPGRTYHGKKNHLHRFARAHAFSFVPMADAHREECLAMQETWCQCHRCAEDLNLMGEWQAIREVLEHFSDLQLQGAVIIVDGRVEAFTLGELLNRETAVVHIEKANAAMHGLYAAINQQFCQHCWQGTAYINREQDVGDAGLRQAKLSYHPDHLVEKFRIELAVR